MHTAQSVTFVHSGDESSVQGTPLPPSAVYDSAKKASYFEQAFAIEAFIGAGCFGNVYRVRAKEDGGLYAVKIARDTYRGIGDRAQKLEEVRKHQLLLPHSNCVHFYQSWEEKGRLYQQFELCQRSLMELSEAEHEIPERAIWGYLVDLLLAIEHLHDHGLIHMDIKPENIFIGRDGRAKLGDFGLVIDLAKDDTAHAVEGDPRYLASEILELKQFTKAADIFSLGVTILELACDLDLPKHGPLWHKLRKQGPDPNLTSRLSHDLRRVIQLMMTNYTDRRPTVKQMLALPAIQEARVRRQRELAFREFWSGIRQWFSPLILFALYLWTLLVISPADHVKSFLMGLFGGDQVDCTPPPSSNASAVANAAAAVSSDLSSQHRHQHDPFKYPELPEVSSTDHLAKFYIGDNASSSSSFPTVAAASAAGSNNEDELSSSFLEHSSSSHQNSPLARPLTLNFSEDSSDDSCEQQRQESQDASSPTKNQSAVNNMSSQNVAPAGSTPKLARSTPTSGLRFRQRLLEASSNGGGGGVGTPGGSLSSPKKRLNFDCMESTVKRSPLPSAKASNGAAAAQCSSGGGEQAGGGASPRLSYGSSSSSSRVSLKRTPLKPPQYSDSEDDCSGGGGGLARGGGADGGGAADSCGGGGGSRTTPKSHSRKTKVHFHRSLSVRGIASNNGGGGGGSSLDVEGAALDQDEHPEIKPLSLVARFDCFSDDTENDE